MKKIIRISPLFFLLLTSCDFLMSSSSEENPSKSDETSSSQIENSTNSVSSSKPEVSSTPVSSQDNNLLWSDEFNGKTIDENKWAFDIGNGSQGWGNWEKEYYRKENAYVSNGTLKIVAKNENYGGFQYTSAKLKTLGKFDFTYGRVEARIKLPAISGTWPAFWMLPTNTLNNKGWPWNGEIDIMENKGNEYNKTSSTVHSAGNETQTYSHYVTKEYTLASRVDNWHTYSVDWREGKISFFVDNNLFHTVTEDSWKSPNYSSYQKGEPFNKRFYLILNLAIGGQFINQALPNSSLLPTQMEVDYVRVYK